MQIDRDRAVFICGHCGNQQQAAAAAAYLQLLTETQWNCPICSVALSSATLEGCPLLCCSRCFGLLIERAWFTAVIDAARAHEPRASRPLPRQQHPAERSIACPLCGQAMHGHIYAGPGNVVIDSCERCQVNWLDGSELRRIAIAPGWPVDGDT